MEVLVDTQSAKIKTTALSYCFMGTYLGSGLGNCGGSITKIEVLVSFRGGPFGSPESKVAYDAFHEQYLPTLPTAIIDRKKRIVKLEYETKLHEGPFIRKDKEISAEVANAALRELAEQFRLIDTLVKKSDGFDLERFHADVAGLIARAPKSDQEARDLNQRISSEARAQWQVRQAEMDPWETLGVDWKKYHPNAKALLNETFYWETVAGDGPHASDTGADVLTSFKRWNGRNKKRAAWELAVKLLDAWKLKLESLDAVDEGTVVAVLERNPHSVSASDDTIIAAAFAGVKLRGCCDEATRRMALAAIAREELNVVIKSRGWRNPHERLKVLAKFREVLMKVPETAE